MKSSASLKIGALGGIFHFLLQAISQALFQQGGMEPRFNADLQEILNFFLQKDPLLFEIGSYLFALSFIFFLWFLVVLWRRIREFESEHNWLATLMLGAGIISIAISMSTGAAWYLAVFRQSQLDGGLAVFLFDLGNFGYVSMWVFLGVMLIAFGALVRRTGVFKSWIAWYSIIVGILLIIGRAFWTDPSGTVFVPFLLYWIWLIISGVALVKREKIRR